jgi:hypothetical protein
MPISISPNSTTLQQHLQSQTYIQSHVQSWSFNNRERFFSPITALLNLATLDNIQTVSAQDAGLASLSHFPPHSREYFAIRISQYGRRCFVGALNCGLGMDFLLKLTNIVEDSKLPVRWRVNIETAYPDALLIFKAA